MPQDPVCGMQVNDKKVARSLNYKGTIYYFCTEACRAAFEKNPERYSGKAGTYMAV